MTARLLADLIGPNFPQGTALLRWSPGMQGHLALAYVVGPPSLRERDQATLYGGTLVPDLKDPATEGVLKSLARQLPEQSSYTYCMYYRGEWYVHDLGGPVKVKGDMIKGESEGEAWANLILASVKRE